VSERETEIGQLYVQGARELDDQKRKAIYGKAQIIAQEQVPFIQLVNQMSMAAVRNRFEEIQFSDLEGAFWNLEEIKVKLAP